MLCNQCRIEMEQLPSVIKIGKVTVGNPKIKMWRCPKCKHLHVEERAPLVK